MAKRARSNYERDGFKLGRREGRWIIDCRGKGNYGGPKRVGLKARSEADARIECNEWVEAFEAVKRQREAVTVGELWRWWTKERTQDGFRNDIYMAQWVSLAPHFAAKKAEDLSAADFREYARARFAQGRSAWTVHTELSRCISCLKRAAKARKIVMPETWNCSQGKHRDRVLSVEEAHRLLEAAREGDPHVALFVVIAFATGARHAAILDLTWDRVDFINGRLAFDENIQPDPMAKCWRKGRATVPMNRAVRAALEVAYEGRQSEWVIEHGGHKLKSIREGFRNAVSRAGLDRSITPHTIRHSVASWLEDRVGDARRAQLLGHGNVETTRRVYTHSGAELLTEAVSYLDFAPMGKTEGKRDDTDARR